MRVSLARVTTSMTSKAESEDELRDRLWKEHAQDDLLTLDALRGALTELHAGLRRQQMSPSMFTEFTEAMFQMADKDDSGDISYDEWEYLFSRLVAQAETGELLLGKLFAPPSDPNAAVDADVLDRLAHQLQDSMRYITVDADDADDLWRKGDTADCVYIVYSGRVALCADVDEGDGTCEVQLHEFGDGEVVGDIEALLGVQRMFHLRVIPSPHSLAVVSTKVTLIKLTSDALLSLIAADATLAQQVMANAHARVDFFTQFSVHAIFHLPTAAAEAYTSDAKRRAVKRDSSSMSSTSSWAPMRRRSGSLERNDVVGCRSSLVTICEQLFGDEVSRETIEGVVAKLRKKCYRSGDIILQEGQDLTQLKLVTKGRVGLFDECGRLLDVVQPTTKDVGLLAIGAFLGSTCVPQTAKCLDDQVVVVTLDRPTWQSLIHAHPSVVVRLGTLHLRTCVDQLLSMESVYETKELSRAEFLWRKGDDPDAFYVVLTGRLLSYDEDREEVVAHYGAGALVGELSLLADEPRPSHMRAVRHTSLIRFSHHHFHHMLEANPSLVRHVMRTVALASQSAAHSRTPFKRANALANRACKTFVVVPQSGDSAGGERVLSFAHRLTHALQSLGPCQLLHSGIVDDRYGHTLGTRVATATQLFRFLLGDVERHNRHVVLVCDNEVSPWTQHCLSAADTVLVVADVGDDPNDDALETLLKLYPQVPKASSGGLPVKGSRQPMFGLRSSTAVATSADRVNIGRSSLRQSRGGTVAAGGRAGLTLSGITPFVSSGSVLNHTCERHLILLHVDDDEAPQESDADASTSSTPGLACDVRAWLLKRPGLHAHHHIRMHQRDEVHRLARHITGHSVGVVLSGPMGAPAMAHIGALCALRELGLPLDMVGGSNGGAAAAALAALQCDGPTMKRALWNISPHHTSADSLLDMFLWLLNTNHTSDRRWLKTLKYTFGDVFIEDLALDGFFSVSTNLTTEMAEVHRSGPMHEAVAASCSLPLLFPALVKDDALHVNGDFSAPLPVSEMALGGAGAIVGIEVRKASPMDVALALADSTGEPMASVASGAGGGGAGVSSWWTPWRKSKKGLVDQLANVCAKHAHAEVDDDDIVVTIPIQANTDDWHLARKIIETGYHETKSQLEATGYLKRAAVTTAVSCMEKVAKGVVADDGDDGDDGTVLGDWMDEPMQPSRSKVTMAIGLLGAAVTGVFVYRAVFHSRIFAGWSSK